MENTSPIQPTPEETSPDVTAVTDPQPTTTPDPIPETPAPVTEITTPPPVSNYFIQNYAFMIIQVGSNRLSPRGKYTGIPEEYRVPVMEYAAYQFDPFDIEFCHMRGFITTAEYEQIVAYREGGYFG